jgi:hypothetical protein
MIQTQDKNREIFNQFVDFLPTASYHQAVRVPAELCKYDRYFLLTQILRRADALHPWIYDRCREVEAVPDDNLDLWARGHYKSSVITFAGAMQEIIKDPEVTIGIFANTRPIAKPFLNQIKSENETNPLLNRFWPDIFWINPRRESPKWSLDDGLLFKRRSNPREPTVSAWGLIDGQPTGYHFKLRIYDDVVTENSVGTPDMILKTTDRWELSQNLSKLEKDEKETPPRQWHVGTRYHFADTYNALLLRKALRARVYPATDDGTSSNGYGSTKLGRKLSILLFSETLLLRKRKAHQIPQFV